MSVRNNTAGALPAVTLALLTTAAVPASAGAAGALVVILDGSRSMWGQIEGTAKVDVAREGVEALLRGLPAQVPAGLVAYGYRRDGDCADVQVLVPPAAGSGPVLERALKGLKPRGRAPVAAALEKTIEGLGDEVTGAELVLIADGGDNCRADPCALVRGLDAARRPRALHVVGLGLASKDASALRCVAEAGGGTFTAAADARALGAALEAVVRSRAAAGGAPAVSGGAASAPAPALSAAPLPAADAPSPGAPESGDPPPAPTPLTAPAAQAGTPTPAAADAALGTLILDGADFPGQVVDAATGERLGSVGGPGDPARLPPGTYRVTLGGALVGEATLAAGAWVRLDAAARMGHVVLRGSTAFAHLTDGAGIRRALLGPGAERRQVPAGRYRLVLDNLTVEDVVVPAGAEVVVDLGDRVGWLALRDAALFAHAFDQTSGRRVAILSPGGEPKQVPAGTYRIRTQGRDLAVVTVAPGQTVTVE